MTDGPDGQVPRRRRSPDSIWERYLTGKLSLEDTETLPALIKELHQEIAQHLGHKVDAIDPEDAEPIEPVPPAAPPPPRKRAPIIDIKIRGARIAKRRIDPEKN
jgi:hypothetical protein